jgi:hypothetical protein
VNRAVTNDCRWDWRQYLDEAVLWELVDDDGHPGMLFGGRRLRSVVGGNEWSVALLICFMISSRTFDVISKSEVQRFEAVIRSSNPFLKKTNFVASLR